MLQQIYLYNIDKNLHETIIISNHKSVHGLTTPESWRVAPKVMHEDGQLYKRKSDSLVGSTFGSGPGEPGSISSLRVTLYLLPHQIQSAM